MLERKLGSLGPDETYQHEMWPAREGGVYLGIRSSGAQRGGRSCAHLIALDADLQESGRWDLEGTEEVAHVIPSADGRCLWATGTSREDASLFRIDRSATTPPARWNAPAPGGRRRYCSGQILENERMVLVVGTDVGPNQGGYTSRYAVAFNPATGDTLWEIILQDDRWGYFAGGLLVDDRSALIVDSAGRLFDVDLASGKLRLGATLQGFERCYDGHDWTRRADIACASFDGCLWVQSSSSLWELFDLKGRRIQPSDEGLRLAASSAEAWLTRDARWFVEGKTRRAPDVGFPGALSPDGHTLYGLAADPDDDGVVRMHAASIRRCRWEEIPSHPLTA